MESFPTETYAVQTAGFYDLLCSCSGITDTLTGADTWTVRNHTAHLIDSASNNHQRFVRLQLAERVTFPGYEAEPWVNVSGTENMEFGRLALLWKLYNEYLLEVVRSIRKDCLAHEWERDGGTEPVTLEFLVTDYYAHMAVHEQMIRGIAAAAQLQAEEK
jgi:hypothetical protein